MNNPISTYRIQFHKAFTFSDFEKIIPYLHGLGISTVYASPIFEAKPGSMHGYDGMNPHKINPEIGTEGQLVKIRRRLKELDMKWVQDIVPNHMAFDPQNPWLKDVLEKGEKSVYASFFDVPWTGQLYSGKIMLPFLGDTLEEAIDKGELKITFEEPRFVLKNFDNSWPIRLLTYSHILQTATAKPNEAVQQLLSQIDYIRKEENPNIYHETLHEFQLQLTALVKNEATKNYIEQCVNEVNADKELLKKIANEQVYQLVNWKDTEQRITFRRFFTVNGLICLNMQNDEVFQHYHIYIKYLVDEDLIQGLRIDHIDGLFDPTDYFEKLRKLVGDETYIVAEKILEPGEEMPTKWPIEGSTGYDFLAMVNNVFTNKKSKHQFTFYFKNLTNDNRSVAQQIHDSKSKILFGYMGGELENLYHLFIALNLSEKAELENLQEGLLKEAIAQFLIECPVYRYYGKRMPLEPADAQSISNILNKVIAINNQLAPAVKLLEKALLSEPLQNEKNYNQNALRFYQRCMQFTGPLMAKGVEDTIMYAYNRFIGHNEVGDAPDIFGYDVSEFHKLMIDRQKKWPLSVNTTSTHDTKRGEDVRARLNVLTDLGEEWLATAEEWHTMNAHFKQNDAPDNNDEYLIYQVIIGSMPMPGIADDFKNRLMEYLQKALRESKRMSNWSAPDEAYENGAKLFAEKLLDTSNTFYKSFAKLHEKVADFGIINALAQVILKYTCPGVPDVYQGTELWDFSLVDPDNRRLVDYTIRENLLKKIKDQSSDTAVLFINNLWDERYTGGIKLWLIHHLLQLRNERPLLFSEGDYFPLQVEGDYKTNVLAFARKFKNDWLIVVVPLHIAEVCNYDAGQILLSDWKQTKIILPDDAPQSFTNILTDTRIIHDGEIAVQDIFSTLPLTLLK